MQEKGYVYILTNPSFREDWVKIGMSARPVDIRSKELDNTAVPLPFEIYATVKTSKYKEIEKHSISNSQTSLMPESAKVVNSLIFVQKRRLCILNY